MTIGCHSRLLSFEHLQLKSLVEVALHVDTMLHAVGAWEKEGRGRKEERRERLRLRPHCRQEADMQTNKRGLGWGRKNLTKKAVSLENRRRGERMRLGWGERSGCSARPSTCL
jgi:hypothetical protein